MHSALDRWRILLLRLSSEGINFAFAIRFIRRANYFLRREEQLPAIAGTCRFKKTLIHTVPTPCLERDGTQIASYSQNVEIHTKCWLFCDMCTIEKAAPTSRRSNASVTLYQPPKYHYIIIIFVRIKREDRYRGPSVSFANGINHAAILLTGRILLVTRNFK